MLNASIRLTTLFCVSAPKKISPTRAPPNLILGVRGDRDPCLQCLLRPKLSHSRPTLVINAFPVLFVPFTWRMCSPPPIVYLVPRLFPSPPFFDSASRYSPRVVISVFPAVIGQVRGHKHDITQQYTCAVQQHALG